jgi:conjugal transfer pilus assembly protein TraV
MSTLDVYEATNSADRVEGHRHEGKDAPTSNSAPTAYGDAYSLGTRIDGDTLALSSAPRAAIEPSYTTTYHATRDSEPYRSAARVMRIYVSAWEDEQGDLHMPGYIFSELEARRWSVGQPAIDSSNTFRLLEGPGQQAAQDARAAAGATADAGRPVRTGKPN